MPINLVKGQNHVLNMNIFHVGLGWDVNEGASPYPFDLDVSAFMIGANKKILNDDFLVYYNSEHRVLPSNLTRFEPFSARKRPRFVDGHLGLNKCKQPIINHISKSASKKHDRCMMVE